MMDASAAAICLSFPSQACTRYRSDHLDISSPAHPCLPAPERLCQQIGRPQRLDYVAATNTDTGYVMRPRDYQPHRCAPPPCTQTAHFSAFSGSTRPSL
ncbi:hypothetical protein DENSPDRAFT_431227 [Dentipellis sp. KUC8613]|nr:hypothetical protein DENSPDRAFT_431227 [Dentipellis sp. KUC8613]